MPRQRWRPYYLVGKLLQEVVDGNDSDSVGWPTDTDWWNEENKENQYPPERLRAEQDAANTDGVYLTQLWWAKRTSDRRYRAATGRFMPKHKMVRKKTGKTRYTKEAP